jgi:iron complex transport system ATP-binding protein
LLRAADVTFGYGAKTVIEGVSLEVPSGGFVGIIGPNGSGKTTLLRLLAGTRKPQQGSVHLDDVPLASQRRSEIARRMAVVPQETQLAFEYTVLEVVLMGRYTHLGAFEIEGPRDVELARTALRSTGTLALEDRAFSTLSGGEKQRVIIAAALAQITGPDGACVRGAVLLLDEPTAALDLKYQLGVAALLRSVQRDRNLTIIVSTHDLPFAAGLCSTLVMLKDGRVMASGAAADVLTPPRIRELYGVEVEIARHESTGRIVVVPVRPVEVEPRA